MRSLALYRRFFIQISPHKSARNFHSPPARLMSTSIPQIRASSHSDVQEPALKKQRIDVAEPEISMEVENPSEKENVEETVPASISLSEVEAGSGKQPKGPQMKKRRKRRDPPLPEPCSAADVQYKEIRELLGGDVVDEVTEAGNAFQSPFAYREEVTVTIESLGSGGSGLARAPSEKGPWAVVVPVALPGETVRVKIVKNDRMHSCGQVVEILVRDTKMRDDSLVRCEYFGTCGGCQYQMLTDEKQLELKRDVIVKAYKTYSSLPESSIPPIESTVQSPLVYNYRTKLTPHFERPPKAVRNDVIPPGEQPSWLQIGFNVANNKSTLDIEECPIATPILNEKYKSDRQDIIKNILSYQKGVSLMYRDSLDTTFDAKEMMTPPIDKLSDAFTKHVCVSDQNATSREMVGDYLFEYTAGGFFQNNNAVLPHMVNFVKDLIQSSGGLTHLVDTYCGAGLFAISLSSLFEKVAGIELSKSSIASAKTNAELNGIPSSKISFLSGTASDIFATVQAFPRAQTAVVIDPPRKGCDDVFLEQLLRFRPALVVYVSCNVHSQARDVGYIVSKTAGEAEGRRYRLERLRGFDLFPQTAHVESVALLKLY